MSRGRALRYSVDAFNVLDDSAVDDAFSNPSVLIAPRGDEDLLPRTAKRLLSKFDQEPMSQRLAPGSCMAITAKTAIRDIGCMNQEIQPAAFDDITARGGATRMNRRRASRSS